MAKKKRSWAGWSPNITSGTPTGGTAYEPNPGGSFRPGAPSGAAPSAAPAAITPTQSQLPVVNSHDAQYGQDTSSIITSLPGTAREFGAADPTVTYVDKNGNPTTASDPNGKPVVGSTQVNWADPNGVAKLNPFSRAALLIRSYQQGVQGTSNSYAARGQHSSGAYQRAQNSNQFGFDQGRSGIDTALQNWITTANQNLAQAGINALTRQEDKPPAVIPGSSVNAVGTSVFGNQSANGAPSANQVLSRWGSRPDANGNAPSGMNGTVKLANGWTMVYVNGKPKFIPPGGSA